MSDSFDFTMITDIRDKFVVIGGSAKYGQTWKQAYPIPNGPQWAPAHVFVAHGEIQMDVCGVISFLAKAGDNMSSYQKHGGNICYTAEDNENCTYCIRAHPSSPYARSWGVGQALNNEAGSFAFDDGAGAVFVLEGDVNINGVDYSATPAHESFHLIEFVQGEQASYSGAGVIAIIWAHPDHIAIDDYQHPLVTPLLRGEPYVA